MSIRNLEFATRRHSLAVIGASIREGSMGRVVMENIVGSGFEGPIWPVNPKYEEIAGRRCFREAVALPAAPDLAVVMTPQPRFYRSLQSLVRRVAGPPSS